MHLQRATKGGAVSYDHTHLAGGTKDWGTDDLVAGEIVALGSPAHAASLGAYSNTDHWFGGMFVDE